MELKPLTFDRPIESPATYIGNLLQSVSIVHAMHLNTKSYARHMALDEYYKGMPEVADAFAEAYIQHTEATITPLCTYPHTSAEELLNSLRDGGYAIHPTLKPDLTNALEDVLTFISSILYKLRLS